MKPVFLHVKFIGNKLSVTDPDLAQNGFQSADFFSWLFCCTIQITLHRNIQVQLCNKKAAIAGCPRRVKFIRFTSRLKDSKLFVYSKIHVLFLHGSPLQRTSRASPSRSVQTRPWFEIFFAKKYLTKTAKCHVDLTALADSYVVSLSANIEGTGFLSGHADGSIVRWYVADDHNPRPQVSQTTLDRNKRHKAEQMTLLNLQRYHKGTVKCAPPPRYLWRSKDTFIAQ